MPYLWVKHARELAIINRNEADKELERQRNREAKRRSRLALLHPYAKSNLVIRQRQREAGQHGLQPGPSNDYARAAVEAAMQRILQPQAPEASGSVLSQPPLPSHVSLDTARPPVEDDNSIDPSLVFPGSVPLVPPPQRNPTPPLDDNPTSTHPPHDPLDLVTGICGVQISKHAPSVTWRSGQKTILPYLDGRDKNHRKINLLQRDARHVQDLADIPESQPSSEYVVFLDQSMPKPELLKASREALSMNKTVVIKGHLDIAGFNLSMEGLASEFCTLPARPIGVHGMCSSVYILLTRYYLPQTCVSARKISVNPMCIRPWSNW